MRDRLESLPRLRFNKEGNLLAVTTADNEFKILANTVGLRYAKVNENPPSEALRNPIESSSVKVSGSSAVTSASTVNLKVERCSPVSPSPILNGVDPLGSGLEKPRTVEEAVDKAKPWQLTEIVDTVQCRLVTMPDNTETSSKAVRLLYTNSGVGVLGLGANGVQKLWKWARNGQNPNGKVKSELKGHQKRITGLAFSTNLNILVSSGADAQLKVQADNMRRSFGCTWTYWAWSDVSACAYALGHAYA
ncbi:hypothetical protein CRG98_029839 [Punica granatum]|uniref:Uncharacterized protein n=1 Tax=Punica granatum TaxID=22663 RepID=A0A2I0J1J1_PUNGR|nr:hypothetical protein CRG98_029839 [Punica granatum]